VSALQLLLLLLLLLLLQALSLQASCCRATAAPAGPERLQGAAWRCHCHFPFSLLLLLLLLLPQAPSFPSFLLLRHNCGCWI
jgi:hypothetical protein